MLIQLPICVCPVAHPEEEHPEHPHLPASLPHSFPSVACLGWASTPRAADSPACTCLQCPHFPLFPAPSCPSLLHHSDLLEIGLDPEDLDVVWELFDRVGGGAVGAVRKAGGVGCWEGVWELFDRVGVMKGWVSEAVLGAILFVVGVLGSEALWPELKRQSWPLPAPPPQDHDDRVTREEIKETAVAFYNQVGSTASEPLVPPSLHLYKACTIHARIRSTCPLVLNHLQYSRAALPCAACTAACIACSPQLFVSPPHVSSGP